MTPTQSRRARPPARNGSLVARGPPASGTDRPIFFQDSQDRASDGVFLLDLNTSGEGRDAANEEPLPSKEELQSRNDKLSALNSQLRVALERQHTTSNDLQNMFYSTDVATLVLDPDLNIRFFTPAAKALFDLKPGDVGRPLADLKTLAVDPCLAGDARAVLHDQAPVECDIEVPGARWFLRRILPYRTHDDGVEGVVITFIDISERMAARRALEAAKREAEQANFAKSRFLAAASHDLRQPLQTLALLQGLLVKAVESERGQSLIVRLNETLVTLSGMLDTMLDINQIEAGVVQPKPTDFVVGELIQRVRDEFVDQAQAKKLDLRVVRCTRAVEPTSAPKFRDARTGTIYIIDDDKTVRDGLRELLEQDGRIVESFEDCETFLANYRPGGETCLLVDAYLPGINGIDLLRQLKAAGHHLPAIMITGSSDVPMAVEAMKSGAIDFIEKPVACDELLASIDRALVLSREAGKLSEWQADAATYLDGLTARQHQVMDLVLAGHPSKNIAADLRISQRTVENHRAAIMRKTGAKSLPALARLAVAAAGPKFATHILDAHRIVTINPGRHCDAG